MAMLWSWNYAQVAISTEKADYITEYKCQFYRPKFPLKGEKQWKSMENTRNCGIKHLKIQMEKYNKVCKKRADNVALSCRFLSCLMLMSLILSWIVWFF